MNDARIEKFDEIVKMGRKNTEELIQYWTDYALYTSLEYWIMVMLFIGPLLLLFF